MVMPTDWRDLLDSLEDWQGFIITVGAGLVNAILLATGRMTGDNFVAVTASTVSVFLGSRAWAQRGQNVQSPPATG